MPSLSWFVLGKLDVQAAAKVTLLFSVTVKAHLQKITLSLRSEVSRLKTFLIAVR